MRDKINKLPKEPGVYIIKNTINGFTYVGSAGKQGIRARLRVHLYDLNNKKHHSWSLQRDWNSNQECWDIFVVGLYDPSTAKVIEQSIIDGYGVGIKNNSYNILDKVNHESLPDSVRKKIIKSNRDIKTQWKTNKSGFRGVCWHKNRNKWKATIYRYGHSYHIGFFDIKEEAYNEYLKVSKLDDVEFEKWWKDISLKRKETPLSGENARSFKLSDGDIGVIDRLLSEKKHTQKQIAKMFNVDSSWISRLSTRNKKIAKRNQQSDKSNAKMARHS